MNWLAILPFILGMPHPTAVIDEAEEVVRLLEWEVDWFERVEARQSRRPGEGTAVTSQASVEAASMSSLQAGLANVMGAEFAARLLRLREDERRFEFLQPLRARCLAGLLKLDTLAKTRRVPPEIWWRWWKVYDGVSSRLLDRARGSAERRRALFEERRAAVERLGPRLSGNDTLRDVVVSIETKIAVERIQEWLERLERPTTSEVISVLDEVLSEFSVSSGRAVPHAEWLERLEHGERGTPLALQVKRLVARLYPLPNERPLLGGPSTTSVQERLQRLAAVVEDVRPVVAWGDDRQWAIESAYDAPLRLALEHFQSASQAAEKAVALKSFFDAFARMRTAGYELSVLRGELAQLWQAWEFHQQPWLDFDFEVEDVAIQRLATGSRPHIVTLQWWDEETDERELVPFEADPDLMIRWDDLQDLDPRVLPPGHYVCTIEVALAGGDPDSAEEHTSSLLWHLCLVHDDVALQAISFPTEWPVGFDPIAHRTDGRRSGWFFERRPLDVRSYLMALQRFARAQFGQSRSTDGFLNDWRELFQESNLGEVLVRAGLARAHAPEGALRLARDEVPTFQRLAAELTRLIDALSPAESVALSVPKHLWDELGGRKADAREALEGPSANEWLTLPDPSFLNALLLQKGNPYRLGENVELAMPAGQRAFGGPLVPVSEAKRRVVVRRIITSSAEAKR